MENLREITYFEIIRKSGQKIALVFLISIVIGLLISVLSPFEYRASASILVMQKSGFSIDAYSASKSEERIAGNLGQLVQSSTFTDKVLNNGAYAIQKDYFKTGDEQKKRDKWVKAVQTEVPAGIGKLVINVYHEDPAQAMIISRAVIETLVNNRDEFLAISDVNLRVIDNPLVSKYPVKPNIILNFLLSAIIGVLAGVSLSITTFKPIENDKLFNIYEKKSDMDFEMALENFDTK